MAEQPIKGTDIIESGMFNEAVKQADNFIAKLTELETGIKSNLQSSKEYLSTWKAQGSETLNTQAKATAEVTKELKQLEQLEQQRIKTEIAKSNLFKAQSNANKSALAEEIALTKKAQSEIEKKHKIQNDANKEIERTTKAFNKIKEEEIKLEEKFTKSLIDEAKETVKTTEATKKKTNELTKAKVQLKELSDRLELNTFKIKQNALADTESGRSRARTAKLVADEQKKLFDVISSGERQAGRFTRTVGDYKSSYDGLGNSVNQLTRELPAFAVSANTGFLAISNNLPIFFDQLAKINKENANLVKQGKPTESVFKQLGSAVFSFGSLLSIGVTLLTLFGGKLFELVSELVDSEKALESATEANKKFNESMSDSIDRIRNAKIDIRVLTKEITAYDGSVLKSENGRIKALNESSKTRKESIKTIKEEIGVTDLQISQYGKTVEFYSANEKQMVKRDVLSKSQTEKVKKYNNELQKLNQTEKQNRDIINEEFNDIAKKLKLEEAEREANKKKEKALTDLTYRIAKLNAEQIKNETEKNIELNKIDTEYAISEVEKIKATEIQKAQLIQAIRIDSANKLRAIEDKFFEDYEKQQSDLLAKQNETIKSEIQKTYNARVKLITDNKEFEIYQLEEKFKEEQAKGAKADKEELKRLNDKINERKALLIQAKANEAKIDKNDAEKVTIQNEADIEIAKLKNASDKDTKDKDIKSKEDELKRQNDFNQKLIDAFAKAQAEKSKLAQDAISRDISDTEKNIDRQRRLAEDGKANTLAFEEAELEKKKIALEKEKQDEIKRQKAIAVFKAFTAFMEKGDAPLEALAKAVASVALVDSFAGAFFEGTEKVENDLQGNKLHNGRDGYRIAVDGSERIMTGDQNKLVGNMSNEALASLASDYNNGLLETAKYAVIQKDFGTNIKESVMLMQMANLNKQVESLTNTIKQRPISNFEFDGYGNFIKTTIENGFEKRTTFKQERPRI